MNRDARLPQDDLTFKDLSFYAIRRWRLVLVGALGLLALGALGWSAIPRLEEPRIDVPMLGIVLPYPGASPEDVEVKVLRPVEEVLYGLQGVEFVEAVAIPNAAILNLKFEDNVTMDVAVEKVRGKVLGKKKDLPTEVKDPEVTHWSTSLTPQMILAVTGHTSEALLSREARRLKTALASIQGVSGIDLVGEFKPAVRVKLDPLRLAQHRMTADMVAQQLQLANVRIPGGEFDVGRYTTLLQINQSFTGAESVAQVPVGLSLDPRGGSRTVRLGEVAEVQEDSLRAPSRFIHRGMPGVGLEVRFRGGEDAVQVGKALRNRIDQERPTLPKGVRLEVAHDQPQWIHETVSGFMKSLMEGMVLVLVVITLGMGWRSALVVSGVIPLSVGGAVLGLYLFGFSLDIVTIGGLIVALGLLVDDAVVVTESVAILRDKGLTSLRAAVFGASRVFWANNGTTAVAIASFLPLFAMGGDTGRYIKGLPLAVILALVTSLLVAQFFTPWISTFLLLKPEGVPEVKDLETYPRSEDRLEGLHQEANPILRRLRALYVRVIPWVMQHPGRVVLGSSLALVLSLGLFKVIGFEFFPKADKPVLFVSLEAATGTRLETTAARMAEATLLLEQDPQVLDTSGMVGESFPEIFSSHIGPGRGSHVADLFVRLRPGTDPVACGQRVRQLLSNLVGMRVKVEELNYGPPTKHPVLVRIYGLDHKVLQAQAEDVKARLRGIPGAVNVRDSLSDSLPLTRVELDADRAFRTGITPAQVGLALRTLHGQDKVTDFRRGEDTVEVVLEQPSQGTRPFGALEETPVTSAAGHEVALKDAGRAVLGRSAAQLNRRNTQRVVEVYADVLPGISAGTVVEELDPWLRARTWPAGTTFGYAGDAEETAKSFQKLGVAAVGAILLIFLLLLLMFDSLLLSILVIVAVPFALLGALPGLALTGNAFGFMAFLGLIALIGVYVNHKIYFVDRMQVLMARGEDLPTAILHAGVDRLRPVVLTALTAVLGLVPLTLSGRMWSAFGWVNIFGLVASIPLSLILLPAFIALAWRWTGRHRATKDPEGVPTHA